MTVTKQPNASTAETDLGFILIGRSMRPFGSSRRRTAPTSLDGAFPQLHNPRMSTAELGHVTTPAHAPDRRRRVAGRLLVLAAGIAFFFPTPYRVLQTVGTMDNRTLDAAGYEDRRAVAAIESPPVRRGDRLLDVIMPLQEAAAQNKHAADKRALALLFGLPGMYLLGSSRRKPLRH
jgi:hypothetical protein